MLTYKPMLDNLKNYDIVLMSGSPRRRELLARLGLTFTVGRSNIDEVCPEGLQYRDIPMYLSRLKAEHCEPAMTGSNLVIAADTIVWCNNEVLGKPSTDEEACAMLSKLSGRQHSVVTGVTLRTAACLRSFYAETIVTFAELTPDEINYYVDTFHPIDKAGAYGIQEWIGMIGVREIRGSYYNVMGLPLHRLYNELKKIEPLCC